MWFVNYNTLEILSTNRPGLKIFYSSVRNKIAINDTVLNTVLADGEVLENNFPYLQTPRDFLGFFVQNLRDEGAIVVDITDFV